MVGGCMCVRVRSCACVVLPLHSCSLPYTRAHEYCQATTRKWVDACGLRPTEATQQSKGRLAGSLPPSHAEEKQQARCHETPAEDLWNHGRVVLVSRSAGSQPTHVDAGLRLHSQNGYPNLPTTVSPCTLEQQADGIVIHDSWLAASRIDEIGLSGREPFLPLK